MGLAEGPQSLLDQGRVGQHPAVQGGVVDRQAALPEQLFDVSIAERVAQVPRDGLQDQRCLEVPALEIILGPALQLLGNRTQDHGPPPTTEVLMPPASSTRGKRQNFATAPDTLHLLAASQTRDKDALTSEGVARVMGELRAKFDWVICDTPAGIERGAQLSMRHADVAVGVAHPAGAAGRGSDRLIRLRDPKTARARTG